MTRRLAIRWGTGRKGFGYSDGHVVREIGQSKVGEDRLEQVRRLTSRANVQRHYRNRQSRRADRPLRVGLELILVRRVLDEGGGPGALPIRRVARVRGGGLPTEPLRDDLCRTDARFS